MSGCSIAGITAAVEGIPMPGDPTIKKNYSIVIGHPGSMKRHPALDRKMEDHFRIRENSRHKKADTRHPHLERSDGGIKWVIKNL